MINFKKWIDMMEDKETMKMLFYLREFNPNATIEDIKQLEINEENIKKKLNNLKGLEMVEYNNPYFKLSDRGVVMVNGFYHDIGEQIPK